MLARSLTLPDMILCLVILHSAVTVSGYNYAAVLHKSLLFYEAQRSGRLPADNRIPWRGDAHVNDSGQDGEDLSGGYYDAGDNVKFGFPMASAMTVLAWGGIQFQGGYRAARELRQLHSAVRWGADYLIKCHVGHDELYGQVGRSDIDHATFTRPEDKTGARPAYKISPAAPGSDLAAETAAAMAAAAILLAEEDQEYSDHLVEHAVQLLEFAQSYPGRYDKSIKDAHNNYPSHDHRDELVWGAVWLFLATGHQEYLDLAERSYDMAGIENSTEFTWDDKGPGVMVLLAQITNKEKYKEDLKSFCDLIVNSKPRSPKGMVFLSKWGSLRHAANVAFICLNAANMDIKREEFTEFAIQQLNYILGDAGHSYVVGYGKDPPQRPHHAASSCPAPPATCDWSNLSMPGPNPHVLEGALVGGPGDADDVWEDDRADYVTNEVSLDYNAGFQGLLAGAIEYKRKLPRL